MKLAIFSDVHANLEALSACVRHAQALGCEGFAGLGDYVNYGADPNACLDLLRTLPGFFGVIGNHDESVVRVSAFPTSAAVQHAAAWTRERLTADNLGFLRELPFVQKKFDCTFVHASADEPTGWPYVYSSVEARACLRASLTTVTFIGHTHWPKVWVETGAQTVRELTPVEGVTIPLRAHARSAIGTGSVGQPRDGVNAACYVAFDTEAREVTFHRVPYDYFSAAQKIHAAGLDPYFAERLARGA
jgi:diadenosine tetraphosphatase ApaH/serine/threonine PP2A family protein phosphatase